MNVVKINPGTPWEKEFDRDIKIGDYVQLTRKYSGKRVGIWKIVEFNRRFVEASNQANFRHYVYGSGYGKTAQYDIPPLGMELVPELKVQRVMKEYFDGKPSRADSTRVHLDKVDIVDGNFIRDLHAEYLNRTDNLKSLLAGTW